MKLYLMVIFTNQLSDSIEFYQKLGFTLNKEKFDQGPEHFCMTLGDTVFDLFPSNDEPTQNLRFGIELDETTDISAISSLAKETYDIGDGKAYSVLHDPNGNIVEVVYYKD